MQQTITVTEQSLLNSASQPSSINGFISKLNVSKETLIEVGVYLGVGFVIGFLLKRFSKVFLALVLTLLLLWFLHHMSIMIVVINWQRLQELFFGVQAVPVIPYGDVGSALWNWITAHVAASISFVIGFLAGIRLG